MNKILLNKSIYSYSSWSLKTYFLSSWLDFISMESLSSFDPFKFGSKRNNLLTAHKTNFRRFFVKLHYNSSFILSDPGKEAEQANREKIGIFWISLWNQIIKMSKKDDIKADEAATTCQSPQKEESQLDKGQLISKWLFGVFNFFRKMN